MDFRYFSKNGEILPLSDAIISLTNIHFQYGFGVYESLRVRKSIVYFAKQHGERLLSSARSIGLEHPFSLDQITEFIQEVINRNAVENCNIKILLVGGKTPGDSLLFILPLAPLYPNRKLYTEGAAVESVCYQRFLPHAKTLNMLPSYLAYRKATNKGNHDALLLDNEGNILEGTRTNFFIVRKKSLVTSPEATVLNGVARQVVLKIAKKHGFSVFEEKIPLSDIANAEGAFLTSTSSKVLPLIQIDTFRFPQIALQIKELMKLYDDFLDNSQGIFSE